MPAIGNLVHNGGFETPVVTHADRWNVYTGNQISPWTIVSTGAIKAEIQKDGVGGWVSSAASGGSVGSQWIELDGDENGPRQKWDANAMGRQEKGLYTIQQEVTGLVPGERYSLRFDFAARPGTSQTNNQLRYRVIDASGTAGEVLVRNLTAESQQIVAKSAKPKWRMATDTFNAPASGRVTIEFTGLGADDTFGMFLDNVAIVPDRVIVTMEVPDGEADEVMEAKGVHRTGTLRLVRTGSLDQALLVKVGIGGDATYSALAWDDYTLSNVVSGLTGYFVTIPAGLSSIELVVTPIQDGTDENTETVTVTVQPYAGYELGEPSTQSGTVEILDAPNISSSSINYRIDIDARKDLYARAYGVDADTQPLPPNGRDTLWTGEPYLFSITGLGGERTDGLAWNIEFTIESVSGGFDIDVVHDEGKGASFPADFDVVADERKSPWRVRFFVDANRDGVRSSSESAITGNFDKVEQNRKALWILQLKDEKQKHEGWIYDEVFGVTDFYDALIARLQDITFIPTVGAAANAEYYAASDTLGVRDAENVPQGISTIIHESVHSLDDAYNLSPGLPFLGTNVFTTESVAWTAQSLLDTQTRALKAIRDFETTLKSPDADRDAIEQEWHRVVTSFEQFMEGLTVTWPFGTSDMADNDIVNTKNRVGLWFNMSGLMFQYQQRLNAVGVPVELRSRSYAGETVREIPSVFLLE